ncbi:MAG: SDR family oxidoreductase [Alphaproteobacteria bacterium]|nr:SDR family oxidoreductase [Alphaproteobacteria bacterium]
MDVQNKKIIIFGGTSGIGAAAARQLADRGAKVVAISRDPSKAGDPGPGITLEKCDVRDAAAVEALLKSQAPYDALISAATGGARAAGPFLEMNMDGFKNSFDKLWGYANVVRYGTEHLPKDGCIVLVSGAPARRARPGQIAIGSVGAAVEQFARTVAREIAPRRINVVAPGQIDTPMVALQGDARREMYAKATANNLIPRAGTAAEVAHAIVFAVENEFITGTTIDVDGGWLQS